MIDKLIQWIVSTLTSWAKLIEQVIEDMADLAAGAPIKESK
jgi:hypothetical protein